jgi:hypothetical protein
VNLLLLRGEVERFLRPETDQLLLLVHVFLDLLRDVVEKSVEIPRLVVLRDLTTKW